MNVAPGSGDLECDVHWCPDRRPRSRSGYRRPDVAPAKRQAERRARPEPLDRRQHLAGFRIDSDKLELAVADPQRIEPQLELDRAEPDVDRIGHLGGIGIDPHQGISGIAGNPDGIGGEHDLLGLIGDVDRCEHFTGRHVDADDVAVLVEPPDRVAILGNREPRDAFEPLQLASRLRVDAHEHLLRALLDPELVPSRNIQEPPSTTPDGRPVEGSIPLTPTSSAWTQTRDGVARTCHVSAPRSIWRTTCGYGFGVLVGADDGVGGGTNTSDGRPPSPMTAARPPAMSSAAATASRRSGGRVIGPRRRIGRRSWRVVARVARICSETRSADTGTSRASSQRRTRRSRS